MTPAGGERDDDIEDDASTIDASRARAPPLLAPAPAPALLPAAEEPDPDPPAPVPLLRRLPFRLLSVVPSIQTRSGRVTKRGGGGRGGCTQENACRRH